MKTEGGTADCATFRLHAIWIAPTAGGAMVGVGQATLEAGHGIVGDRYHVGAGTFSRWPGEGRAVSLIELETIEAVLRESGLDLSAGQHRRNLVTRGVRLPQLIGRTFRVGKDGPLLRGTRVCTECRRPDNLLGHDRPLIKYALHRRPGLRADVLADGVIQIGDPIQSEDRVLPAGDKPQRRRECRGRRSRGSIQV